MKKIAALLLVTLLLVGALAACADTLEPEAPAPPPVAAEPSPMETPDAPEPDDPSDAYELCHCGAHYLHEEVTHPTPPLNMHHVEREWPPADGDEEVHAAAIAEFVRGFETVRTFTYLQWETEWYNTLVFWPDTPLHDLAFVSLGLNDTVQEPYFYTQDVLFTIAELLPTHAFVLNVALEHYLIPRVGLIFTDEHGTQRWMFLAEDMRGGCFPPFLLIPHEESPFADWK